jgi:hypothetical protein
MITDGAGEGSAGHLRRWDMPWRGCDWTLLTSGLKSLIPGADLIFNIMMSYTMLATRDPMVKEIRE